MIKFNVTISSVPIGSIFKVTLVVLLSSLYTVAVTDCMRGSCVSMDSISIRIYSWHAGQPDAGIFYILPGGAHESS